MAYIVTPNLTTFLEDHLSSTALTSREAADVAIKRLHCEDGSHHPYGIIGLRLQEKLEGDIDKRFGGKDGAFSNAILGGRSDSRQLWDTHQAAYNASGFTLSDNVFSFVYEHFGRAAPQLHWLFHILGAFHAINFQETHLTLHSPPNPGTSGLPLIASGRQERKEHEGKKVRLAQGLSKYLTRLALSETRCPPFRVLPFRYVPEKSLETVTGDYTKLVG